MLPSAYIKDKLRCNHPLGDKALCPNSVEAYIIEYLDEVYLSKHRQKRSIKANWTPKEKVYYVLIKHIQLTHTQLLRACSRFAKAGYLHEILAELELEGKIIKLIPDDARTVLYQIVDKPSVETL